MLSVTHHAELLAGVHPLIADTFVTACNEELDFDRQVIAGLRTVAEVAANWAKGREQLPDGSWVIVDEAEVVTHVQHPEDSSHVRAAGADIMPLVSGKLIWTPKDPAWPICLARLQRMAEVAKRVGLEWGGDWIHFKDWDHFQHPQWRSFPMVYN